MVNINSVYGSGSGDTLKADDLPRGAEWLVTITGYEVLPFKQDRKNPITGADEKVDVAKVVLALHELDKKLVCNWTITAAIAQFYGDETDDWVGRKIVLYVDPHVKYGNKVVPGLRVRVPPEEQMRSSRATPPPSAPAPRNHMEEYQQNRTTAPPQRQYAQPGYAHQEPRPAPPPPRRPDYSSPPNAGVIEDDEIPF